MKKLFVVLSLVSLAGCGAMGIGGNNNIIVYNNSDTVLSATGDMGILKIQPNSSKIINTKNSFQLSSPKKECNAPTVSSKLNTAAMVLDIVPGFFFGVIPIVVDAVTGNLNTMPSAYTYDC